MTQVTNTPYEALEVGQTASYSKTVEERDIQLFAAMSGDHNPVHLDPEFAAQSMFKERIAHGMFSGALISAAVACELPGPGTIYIGQQMSFQKPVKIGDTLTVRLEILEKLPKFRVRIATRVFNQRDELVVDGEAEILAPRKQQTVTLPTLPPISIGCGHRARTLVRARLKSRRKKGDRSRPKCLACSCTETTLSLTCACASPSR